MLDLSALAASPAQSPASARAVPLSGNRQERRASASAARRPLVITSERLTDPALQARRLTALAHKNTAAGLMKSVRYSTAKQLSHCGRVPFGAGVELRRNTVTGKASFGGLKACGNVWLCARCSPRIAAERKGELDKLFSGARAEGLAIVMLTLTARHDRHMALAPFLDALKRAKQRLRQRQEWRRLPLVGSVTATETTHGRNGHHPHFHEILLLDCSPADALRLVGALAAVWRVCLEAFGLTGERAALQVQDASAASQYIGKFGAAEELALAGCKRGRNGSRSPWQLLADAAEGDHQAGAIWQEYAAAFRGRRQLVWSPGLKARFKIAEQSDAEAAAEAEAAAQPVEVLRLWLSGAAWRLAGRRVCSLLDAAESGTCLDAAEHGPTDLERWKRERFGPVLEPS